MGIRIEIDSDVLLELIRTKQAEVLEEFADDVDDAIDEAYEDGFAFGTRNVLEELRHVINGMLSGDVVLGETVVEVDFESAREAVDTADIEGFYEVYDGVEPDRDPQVNAQVEGFSFDDIEGWERNAQSEDPFEGRDEPPQRKSGTWVRNPDGTGGMVGGNGS